MSDRRPGRDAHDPRSPRDARDSRERYDRRDPRDHGDRRGGGSGGGPRDVRDPRDPTSSRHRDRPPEPPARDRRDVRDPRSSRDPRERVDGQAPPHRSGGAGASGGRAPSRSRGDWRDERPPHHSSHRHDERDERDGRYGGSGAPRDRRDDAGNDDEWYDDADARDDGYAGGYPRYDERRDPYGRPASPTRPRDPRDDQRERYERQYERQSAPARPPYDPAYGPGYDPRDPRYHSGFDPGYGGAGRASARPGYGQPSARTRPFADGPTTIAPPGWAARGPGPQPGAPPRRKSRRGLWITLGVLATLLLALGGGGALALLQYVAPATEAGMFCGALKAHNATVAYGQFTSTMQAQLTELQFSQVTQALDQIEGGVLTCAGGAYSYRLGSDTAIMAVTIMRATAGALHGNMSLMKENGAWKVSGLDAALLGAGLGALAAASAFCAALQSQDYTAAYGLLASAAQQQTKAQDFAQAAQTHDQIDGKVTVCALVSLGQTQSATGSSLTLSVTRAKLAARKGDITLAAASGDWKIATLDNALLGTDLGPLQVGTRFCADLASANYADAYNLLSPNGKGTATADQFAAQIALPAPLAWAGCTADLSTYKVAGLAASYNAGVNVRDTSTGLSASVPFTFSFVSQNGVWLLDDMRKA